MAIRQTLLAGHKSPLVLSCSFAFKLEGKITLNAQEAKTEKVSAPLASRT